MLIEYFDCIHLDEVICATMTEIAIFLKIQCNDGDSGVWAHNL